MAPARNRKRNRLSKSAAKTAVSDKKLSKKQKEAADNAEATSPEVVVAKKNEDNKVADAKESVPTRPARKPCTWLKLDRLDPQVGNKSSVQSSKQGNEANAAGKAQIAIDNKRKRKEKNDKDGDNDPKSSENHFNSQPAKKEKYSQSEKKEKDSQLEKKEKGIHNDRCEDRENCDDEAGKKPGGLIFMCNAKTKADCFNYQLMGIPANKKEVVMNIKPGLKLFLYDYDLKLLYGIFEASSAGGMKLEPTAFGGGFPAQVRFAVIKECLPLPENMFKKAIKDSYDEKTRKFKTELTVKQVKNLMDMFRPTPWLHPHGRSIGPEGNPMSGAVQAPPPLLTEGYPSNYVFADQGRNHVPLHPENQLIDHHGFPKAAPRQDSLFLTEQEYRNSGLQQGRPVLPATTGGDVGTPSERKILDQELKQLLRNPASTGNDTAASHPHIPNFPSEMEYRMYGLRAPQQMPNAAPEVCDPYDESTTSLVNRYLAMPRTTAVPSDLPPPAGRPVLDGQRAFACYSVGEQQLGFDQRPYSLNSTHGPSCPPPEISAPVSRHYSFGGPSLP